MSFKILANGYPDYQDALPKSHEEAEDLDKAVFLESIMSMEPNMMAVLKGTAEAAVPSLSLIDLVKTYAYNELSHLLCEPIDEIGGLGGDKVIHVSSSTNNSLWPNTLSYARYDFDPGDCPGAEFIRKIFPGLKNTGFATSGVILQIIRVIIDYKSYYEDHKASGNFKLFIQLYR